MIVRILSRGRSFKGLAAYLTHDADAATEERVGWTHTHNLAHDHVGSAVDEMLWTARDAELLKMEAGIRAGGRQTENPVKHLSLNWAPGEEPSREHMIESGEDFLRYMNWHEHQALFVAHEEKEYRHVHLMVNTVHPETGLKLDDNFEYRRAQAWAADYEHEHGLHCENRLKDVHEREEAPTRPAWMAFREKQKIFEENEKSRIFGEPELEFPAENTEDISGQEWRALKALQREEREYFFADGKSAFKEMRAGIFREIREEFREPWADYYGGVRDGLDAETLKEMKAGLVAEQSALLAERRDEACETLLEERKLLYRELLDGQRDMRLGLSERQAAGLESLDLIEHFRVDRDRYTVGREEDERASEERGGRAGREETPDSAYAPSGMGYQGPDGMRSGTAIAGGFADGAFSLAAGFFEFLGGGSSPRPKVRVAPEPTGPDPAKVAADDAAWQAARDAEAEEERKRSESWARSQQ